MTRVSIVALLMISIMYGTKTQEMKCQERESSTGKEDTLKLRNKLGIWRQSDFKEQERVLDSKIGPDESARETLGDYGNHRIRLIHRVGTGAPEFHTHFVDLWIVESGSGTLVVGGSLIDPKPVSGSGSETQGDMTGSSISGGERQDVSTGDVIHIPPKTPHQVLVAKGGEITYLRIAIPSE